MCLVLCVVVATLRYTTLGTRRISFQTDPLLNAKLSCLYLTISYEDQVDISDRVSSYFGKLLPLLDYFRRTCIPLY